MTKQPKEAPSLVGRKLAETARAAVRALPKGLRWGAGSLAAVLIALFVASYLLDEPLRSSIEKRVNGHLTGYSVRLPELHFQLVGGTMTLKGLTVFQEANPEPPIAQFPLLRFGVHWGDLLYGRLVAEFQLDRPQIFINLRQLRTEAASPVPLKERGWQQAVEAIYPLKINVVTIRDGSLTYIDQDRDRPLRLSRVNLVARNIRNVRSADKVYPSSFHLETAIFGSGHGAVDGNANFLAEPYPGINARLKLENVPLDYFRPVIARTNLAIRNGLFSGSGRIEYAPNVKITHLEELTIQGMELDYVHSARTAAAENRRAEEVAKAVKETGRSEMLLRVDRLRLAGCTIGMVNENARPPYRVFLADADLRLVNLSNRFSQGPADAELQGRFMGSGTARATARFRPETNGPDLDLNIRIDDTRLTDMNNLFRAYGNFDVAAGTFSFYSELQIRNDAISGYVKPFFKSMKVYDRRKDKEKKLFHRLYEKLVGGVARLLESRHRGEVATKADIGGPLEKPRISTWQVLRRLIENAFFKTILPGFENEASRPGPTEK